MNKILSLVLLFLIIGCESKKSVEHSYDLKDTKEVGNERKLKYATGFRIFEYQDRIKLVTFDHQNQPYEINLVREGSNSTETNTVSIPITRLVTTSTTHLPALEMLEIGSSLVGFPGIQYISSPLFLSRADSDQLQELGVDQQMDIEAIMKLKPDLIQAFSMNNDTRQWKKLQELGVKVVYNGDYLEKTALGRAEWIKFIAAFYDQLDRADSIFNNIESEYLRLKNLTRMVEKRPTVMSGIMYGDAWFMPGGKNWGATLINDAGGAYIWQQDSSSGWIEIGFENVLKSAKNANFWIGVSSIASLSELEKIDKRYTYFDAFKGKNVFNYTAKVSAGGGFDIMESGYALPQRVLADLIKILHPELLSEHEFYYYERLKQ